MRVTATDMRVLNMATRMPFKYGIATLTRLPHLIVRVEIELDGKRFRGFASDGLPPSWFTKNPDQGFEDELNAMLEVTRQAAKHAIDAGEQANPMLLRCEVHQAQAKAFAPRIDRYPPLLYGFGESLVERAMLDAFCRARKQPFGTLLRAGELGDPCRLRGELDAYAVDQLLPPAVSKVAVRHTVGLADPIEDADIPQAERVDDGLPQSLSASIDAYGLRYFKIKLSGDADRDIDRLLQIASVLEQKAPGGYHHTLDGNEFFREVEPFRQLWERLIAEPRLSGFMSRLLFVEQPFHRHVALTDDHGESLRAWAGRPTMIIDESDGQICDLEYALRNGYSGTSHKNCKGVFKGIANACLIEKRRGEQPDKVYAFSGEDLASVGPISMLQDIGVAANLGLTHVERNGHHYFAGLSMWPEAVQEATLARHGDLYHMHEHGGARSYPALRIRDGAVAIDSVLNAPFGNAIDLDALGFDALTPLDDWAFASLGMT